MTDAFDAITLALPKGRLADQTMALLRAAGIDCAENAGDSRRLVLESGGMRFLLVKPSDVPTYVDYGVADIGVAGKDTLMEENRPLYEMLDLGLGRCRMCVAGFPDAFERRRAGNLRVATKYPGIAGRYFAGLGETIEIIKLNGSVELGPLVGLSDVIVDIVESGGTLRANGLEVLEEVCAISARLVVNRVSLKTKGERVRGIMEGLRAQIGAG